MERIIDDMKREFEMWSESEKTKLASRHRRRQNRVDPESPEAPLLSIRIARENQLLWAKIRRRRVELNIRLNYLRDMTQRLSNLEVRMRLSMDRMDNLNLIIANINREINEHDFDLISKRSAIMFRVMEWLLQGLPTAWQLRLANLQF